MTFQSSFLIRCRLVSKPGSAPLKSFAIQHVQTGAEFRSADLAAVTEWMSAQNVSYFDHMLSQSPATGTDEPQEDLQ